MFEKQEIQLGDVAVILVDRRRKKLQSFTESFLQRNLDSFRGLSFDLLIVVKAIPAAACDVIRAGLRDPSGLVFLTGDNVEGADGDDLS